MVQETKTKKATTTKKASAKKTTTKTTTKRTGHKSMPGFEQIQLKAYQIYVESGYKSNEMENWIKAEKELLSN